MGVLFAAVCSCMCVCVCEHIWVKPWARLFSEAQRRVTVILLSTLLEFGSTRSTDTRALTPTSSQRNGLNRIEVVRGGFGIKWITVVREKKKRCQ